MSNNERYNFWGLQIEYASIAEKVAGVVRLLCFK